LLYFNAKPIYKIGVTTQIGTLLAAPSAFAIIKIAEASEVGYWNGNFDAGYSITMVVVVVIATTGIILTPPAGPERRNRHFEDAHPPGCRERRHRDDEDGSGERHEHQNDGNSKTAILLKPHPITRSTTADITKTTAKVAETNTIFLRISRLGLSPNARYRQKRGRKQ